MKTIKILAREIREFWKDSLLTPTFMILEVIFETLIPIFMGKILTISEGDTIGAAEMKHILLYGFIMLLLAAGGLYSGIMGGKYGSRASTGFGRNLRKSMYRRIQTFSFANIDKFSPASLVTRMTTDVTNVQNSYQMILRMYRTHFR